MIDGKQWTILWNIDDLKLSHVSDSLLDAKIEIINKLFASKEAPLNVRRGTKYDYLGMTIDYSKDGKVSITMFDYIYGFLKDILESLKGDIPTGAPNHLFDVVDLYYKLNARDSKVYYHHTMQLIWISKRDSPDLLPPLSYLTTRVHDPNLHD